MPPDQERQGSVPLLGLEPANTENKQKSADLIEDSNLNATGSPLLGTIAATAVR
jgi:hypothetical protein